MMRGEWFYIFEFRNVKLSEFFPNILTQAKGLLGKNFLSYAIHLLRSFVHIRVELQRVFIIIIIIELIWIKYVPNKKVKAQKKKTMLYRKIPLKYLYS